MEINTVLITIAEFDRLREIEKRLLNYDDLLFVHDTYGCLHLYTKDQVLKDVADFNKKLNERVSKSEAEVSVIKNLLERERKYMSQELAEVRTMSWGQFRKWRKG